MSQISPPIRILLLCAVAFLAAWMLFLRPSADAGTPAADAPAPAASTPPVEAGGEQADSLAGKVVEQANEATAAQDARAEQLAGGAGETAAPPATAAPAATTTRTGAPTGAALPSKEALATVPPDVRRAIRKRQIIVMGVLSPRGADDRLVRRSLTEVDKLHGRVFVRSVPVERVARFGLVTRGADVTQTPSVVVVDFALRATTLAGWVDTATIDQAVVDAIRYSGELYTDPYLRQVARQCTQTFPDMRRLEPKSGPQYSRAIGRFSALTTELKTGIARVSTPAKWRAFSRGVRGDLTALAATTASWRAALGANPTLAQAITARNRYMPAANRSVDRLNQRFDARDVISCGTRG